MTVRPGECWEVGQDGKRRTQSLYPEASEPHSVSDLLRPLATDNARLRRECDELTEQCAELAARVVALEARLEALGRVPL